MRFFSRVKHHPLPVFSRVDTEDRPDRHDDIGCHAAKTAIELNQVIPHLQTHHSVGGDIQHDLTVGHIALGHIDALVIHVDQQMGGAIIVYDPLIDSADNVGAARVQGRPAALGAHLPLLNGQTFLKRFPVEQTIHVIKEWL